ncbi:MAG: cupin domain-containing protein [Phycisphaerales bacterium]
MPDDAKVYRWSDMPTDRPMPLIERQRIIGDKAMLSRVMLAKGFSVETHRHANEQFAVVLSGKIRFRIGEPGDANARVVTLTGGETLHLPSDVPHSADALEDTVVLDIFSPPSATTGVDRA